MPSLLITPFSRNSRSIQHAICQLDVASTLAKDVALGRTPTPLPDRHQAMAGEVKLLPVPGLEDLNPGQSLAVQQALASPLTLIQGNAATGKSKLAARLAFLFTQLNQRLASRQTASSQDSQPKVLVCGPTEESLDVITGTGQHFPGDTFVVFTSKESSIFICEVMVVCVFLFMV